MDMEGNRRVTSNPAHAALQAPPQPLPNISQPAQPKRCLITHGRCEFFVDQALDFLYADEVPPDAFPGTRQNLHPFLHCAGRPGSWRAVRAASFLGEGVPVNRPALPGQLLAVRLHETTIPLFCGQCAWAGCAAVRMPHPSTPPQSSAPAQPYISATTAAHTARVSFRRRP